MKQNDDKEQRLEQFLYIRERMKNVPINNDPFNVWSLWDVQTEEILEFKEMLKKYVNNGESMNNKIYIPDIHKYLHYKIVPNLKPELVLRNN